MLRPATPADLDPLLALTDSVVAWLAARGRSGQWGSAPLSADPGLRDRPLALDHWSGAPELATLYARAGFAEVGTFTLDQGGTPWPGTVRVRPPDAARATSLAPPGR
jgi:hypothetical protein